MVNMGYHPSNVDELFNTEYKWFSQEEIQENRQGHLGNDKKTEKYLNNLYHQDLEDKEKESAY